MISYFVAQPGQTLVLCDSGDTKPDSTNCKLCIETDTGDTYRPGAAGAWTKNATGGPGAEAFPVGSVFISVVSTNPATLLGYGTWAAIGAGRVLVGRDAGDPDFDTLEETGGAKTVTLTVAQMPSHTHVQNAHSHTYASQTATTGGVSSYEHGAIDTSSTAAESSISTNTTVATNQNTGGDGAHSNVQPYLIVNFWKRTA